MRLFRKKKKSLGFSAEDLQHQYPKLKYTLETISRIKPAEPDFDTAKIKQQVMKRISKAGYKRKINILPISLKAAAVFSILLIGIILGRTVFSPGHTGSNSLVPEIPEASDESITQHFKKAGNAIFEFTSLKAEGENGRPFHVKKKEILQLLQSTRFIRLKYSGSGDYDLIEFIEELELILTELSNIPQDDVEYVSVMQEFLVEQKMADKLLSYSPGILKL